MYKIFILCISFLIFGINGFSQSISDYFLTNVGTIYNYETFNTNSGEKVLHETRIIDQSATGEFPGEVLVLYRYKNNYSSTAKVFSVQKDQVGIVLEQNTFGKPTNYIPYSVILKLGGEWTGRSSDHSEFYEYEAKKGSCSIGNVEYSDCIIVTKNIFLSGKYYGTEITYYAKEIGYILQKLIDSEGNPSKFLTVLTSYELGS